MDVFCITTNNPQFQKLLAESGEKQGVFAMTISKWMTQNEVYDRYPTLQELGITVMEGIKPGVEELFDTNLELANAVYEALGFKTNITQDNKTNISLIKEYFRPALTKEFNRPQQFADFGYTLKSNYADEIGTILRSFAENSISKEEFGNRILGVLEEQEFTSDETKDKIFHRELHTLAYTVLSRDLILNNKENILKNILKKDSSNIFELIRVDADNNKFVIRTDYGTSGIGFNPQTNEIWENNNRSILNTNVNQITPQQKQQAQQLYSQYLDTIFPDSKVKDVVYHTNTRGRIEPFNSERGLFITPTLELAKTYKPGLYGKRFQLLINSKNIQEVSEETIMDGKKQSGDTLMYSEPDYTEYVVFEPEQIHILGSKQDIEGFKDFAGSVEDKASESGLSLSSDEAAAYNSLVNDGTIPIKCK